MAKDTVDGYTKKGEVDVGWWMDQIYAGERYRQKYSYEAMWPIWRKMIRGEWEDGVLPKNIFFPMLRSIIPRVYFRNPKVSIRPKQPGFINLAFAQLLNKIANNLIAQSGLKAEMKDGVHDTWLKGSGFMKQGYGNLHGATAGDALGAAPIIDGEERFEYDAKITPGMPWARRVDPGAIVLPDGCRRLKDARWIAERVRRSKNDIQRDPRFKNTDNLPTTAHQTSTQIEYHDPSVENTVDMVDLYEIRDSKFQRVFLIAPDAGHSKSAKNQGRVILDVKKDRLQARGLPYKEIIFNPDDEVVWGIPFAQILHPQQLEANEIRTQTMHHRRASMVKLLAERNAIGEADKTKMFSEDTPAIIETNGPPRNKIQTLQTAYIPQDLQQAEAMVSTDVRETMGFSRNEMGEFQTRRGDTSAEEASNVHAAAEVRLDEMRDSMADLLVAIVEEWLEIVFDNWDTEMIVDVVGPGGRTIWVKVRPSELRHGRYVVGVDPESAAPISQDVREQKAMARYQLLKDNPLIDAQALTHMLITEMEGVEMDEIMTQLPPVEGAPGGSQAEPTSPFGLASTLQQGVQGARSAASAPNLQVV